MSMSKKDFIALADIIIATNRSSNEEYERTGETRTQFFSQHAVNQLADFCANSNPRFMRDRWLGYIAGENGKNGGKVQP